MRQWKSEIKLGFTKLELSVSAENSTSKLCKTNNSQNVSCDWNGCKIGYEKGCLDDIGKRTNWNYTMDAKDWYLTTVVTWWV